MKNTFLLSLIFLFVSFTSAQAQREESVEVAEYPVKGDSEISVSLGTYAGSIQEDFGPTEGTESVNNIGFAVSYDQYFSKTWSIRARLNYDPKGSKDTDTDAKLKATYLSLPVMANWHFGKRKRWNLHFGPAVSFLLSAETSLAGTSEDVKDLFNSSQFGFDFGIGVKIPISSMMFFIEIDGIGDFSTPLISILGEDDSAFVRNSLSIGVVF